MTENELKGAIDRYITLQPEEDGPVMLCDDCSEGIYVGDPYYNVNGKCICQACIEDRKNYA